MSWPAFAAFTVLGIAGLAVPGLLLTWALGLRGTARWASVFPFTVAAAGGGAVIAGLLSIPFTPLSFALLVLTATLVLWLVNRLAVHLARRPGAEPPHGPVPERARSRPALAPRSTPWWPVVAGTAIGAAIIGRAMYWMLGRPENFSQTYDNNFHLNAIRYILDSGNGNSLTMGGLGVADPRYYPAAWHDLVALVVASTDQSIPVGVNVVNVVIAAVAWPLAVMYLSTRLFNDRPAVHLSAGLLSAAAAAFPYHLLNFGVLYPNMLSIVLLPVLLGLLVELMGFAAGPDVNPSGRVLVALLGSAGAVGLAHPSSLLLAMALAVPMFVAGLVRSAARRRRHPGTVAALALVTVAYWFLLQYLWSAGRSGTATAQVWQPYQTSAQALGEAVHGAPPGGPAAWAFAVLTVLGLVALLRSGRWWFVVLWAVALWLFVVSSSEPDFQSRYEVVGIWYNDFNRLAAIIAALSVPVAVAGAVAVYESSIRHAERFWGTERVRQVRFRTAYGWPALVAVPALALVGFLPTQGQAISAVVANGVATYRLDDHSPLLDADELALLERLGETVPEDAVILGNPYTGAGLAYALSGRTVIDPHPRLNRSADVELLNQELDELESRSEVCSALERTGVRYVLDFGTDEVHGHQHPYQGIDELDPANGFELVDQVAPDARLFEITGCPGL